MTQEDKTMTQEDKELLLKDLCSRLPYKVMCRYSGEIPMIGEVTNNIGVLSNIYVDKDCPFEINGGIYGFADVKLYLRPMSSMTEEEKEELKSKCIHTETEEDWEGVRSDVWGIQIFDKYDTRRWDNPIWPSTINMDAIDWLNSHHFDYRGLIGMGLALEAPEGMYN